MSIEDIIIPGVAGKHRIVSGNTYESALQEALNCAGRLGYIYSAPALASLRLRVPILHPLWNISFHTASELDLGLVDVMGDLTEVCQESREEPKKQLAGLVLHNKTLSTDLNWVRENSNRNADYEPRMPFNIPDHTFLDLTEGVYPNGASIKGKDDVKEFETENWARKFNEQEIIRSLFICCQNMNADPSQSNLFLTNILGFDSGRYLKKLIDAEQTSLFRNRDFDYAHAIKKREDEGRISNLCGPIVLRKINQSGETIEHISTGDQLDTERYSFLVKQGLFGGISRRTKRVVGLSLAGLVLVTGVQVLKNQAGISRIETEDLRFRSAHEYVIRGSDQISAGVVNDSKQGEYTEYFLLRSGEITATRLNQLGVQVMYRGYNDVGKMKLLYASGKDLKDGFCFNRPICEGINKLNCQFEADEKLSDSLPGDGNTCNSKVRSLTSLCHTTEMFNDDFRCPADLYPDFKKATKDLLKAVKRK